MDTEFSTLDIVKLMGISRERLRVWMDKGFIRPSIQKAEKRGEKNLFSKVDLYIIGLFRYLLDKGLSWEVAGSYILVLQLQIREEKEQNNQLDVFDLLDSTNTICFLTFHGDEENEPCYKCLFQSVVEAASTINKGSFAHRLDPAVFPKNLINQLDEIMTSKYFINELDESISAKNFAELYAVNFKKITSEISSAME